MNVIVHYPHNLENIKVLEKKVATVHADNVLRFVQGLSCPKEQKLQMMNELREKGLQ